MCKIFSKRKNVNNYLFSLCLLRFYDYCIPILSPLRLPISPSGRCEFYRAGSTEEVMDLAGCCVSPQVDPSIITRGSMNHGPWFDSRPEVPASRF